MTRTTRIATVGLLAAFLFAVAGVGTFRHLRTQTPAVARPPVPDAGTDLVSGGASLGDTITALQQRLKLVPTDWRSYASLGFSYVQEARITADPTYYPKAQGALARSMQLHPIGNEEAWVGMASLAAARHEFSLALRDGERAKAIDRFDANVFGVIGDAQVELGRYPAGFATFQKMVNTLPALSSYARVSYARELQGDVSGALQAMEAARQVAGSPSDVAWASYQIGDLYFNGGRPGQALEAYRFGLQADPSYVPNLAGTAKVAWARGDVPRAIALYTQVVQRYPLPDYVIALGDLYRRAGDLSNAAQQYALVRAEARLFRANGVNVDLELALFDADHGAPKAAVSAARAEWGRRHSILVADAYAWALHAEGRDGEAAVYARRALALGMRNAQISFHAGMIQLALGHRAAARALLARALAINPDFSVRHSPEAVRTLARLGGPR